MPSEQAIETYCQKHGFVRTGVFANAEHTALMARAINEANNTPVARVHGVWLHDDAMYQAKRLIHDVAVKKYSLPPLPPLDGEEDLYGVLVTGEFVKLARKEAP